MKRLLKLQMARFSVCWQRDYDPKNISPKYPKTYESTSVINGTVQKVKISHSLANIASATNR
jgi:hypothetical protein